MGTLTITPLLGPHWPGGSATTCLNGVISFAESLVAPTNNTTLEWSVDWGFCNGQAVSSGGVSQYIFNSSVNYATFKSQLLALPTDTVKTSAYATLPGSDPFPGTPGYNVVSGLGKIWSGGAVTNDGFSGWGTSGWDFDPTGQTCGNGLFGLFSFMWHELSETLFGRARAADSGAFKPTVLDLFSYSAPGTRSFIQAGPPYFSWNGGTTNSTSFSDSSDPGDWVNGTVSPFGAFGIAGNPMITTAQDVQELSAIGVPLSTYGLQYAGIGSSYSFSFGLKR